MDKLARNVLNSAQPEYDGGILGMMLRRMHNANISVAISEVRGFLGPRLRSGYLAGAVSGIIWGLALLILMMTLCWLERKGKTRRLRTPIQTDSTTKTEPTKKKFQKSVLLMELLAKIKARKTNKQVSLLTLAALSLVLLPLLLLLTLAVVNVAMLSRSVSQPGPIPTLTSSTSRQPSAVLPALHHSISLVKSYLASFTDNARRDTRDVVEEIVLATKQMQNATMIRFNSELMARLGVSGTFSLGDEMTRIVVAFFDLSSALLETRRRYEDVRLELYPSSLQPQSGLFRMISRLRDSLSSQLSSCNTTSCISAKAFFHRDFVSDDNFPDTDFASSFLFVMKQRNETRESVMAKSAHGRQKMAETMAKTKRKMDKLVDIPGTVRNMTASSWDKMDVQLRGALAKLDNASIALSSPKVISSASFASSMLAFLLIIPLILTLVVLLLAVSLLCNTARSPRLRLAVYGSLALLSLSLIFSTSIFILGGHLETELCRYLRTDQPILASSNGSNLVLDLDINKVLPGLMRSLPKTDSPTVIPHNALYGLIHRCRNNEPILVALDAVDSMDTAALSKPEASEKIIAVGRMLMIESLTETDPRKMMPADMADSLKQASQLDMFKKIDVDASVAKIPGSPLRERQGDSSRPVPLHIFIDRVDTYLKVEGPLFRDQDVRTSLNNEFNALLLLLERFKLATDKTRALFLDVKKLSDIQPVVKNLEASLSSMVALMANKTLLLGIANQYYDRIIVSKTPENTARIMAKFGPKMMSKLGLCRPLFEAYRSSVDTVCDVVVARLNVSWLYLGAMVLLLSLSLVSLLISLARTMSQSGTSLQPSPLRSRAPSVVPLSSVDTKTTSPSLSRPLVESDSV